MIVVLFLIFSILLAVLSAFVLIPILRKHKYGQTIYELGPKTHQKKQGIPTMGGLIFVVATFIPLIFLFIYSRPSSFLLIAVVAGLLFGLIGFFDDFIKVSKKRSLGLTGIQKIVLQCAFALVICFMLYMNPNISTSIFIPIINTHLELGYWFYPLIVFLFVATTNSANLLDGMDGLLTSNSIIIYATYGVLCFLMYSGIITITTTVDYNKEIYNVFIFILCSIGSSIGFLCFNRYPAKIFMGDTGSLFIGANITVLAIVTDTIALLPIIAFTLVISSLSVIIQRAYFKVTHGKRIFKMSPIHFHFELSGMKETKVVAMYSFIEIVLCAIAIVLLTVFLI